MPYRQSVVVACTPDGEEEEDDAEAIRVRGQDRARDGVMRRKGRKASRGDHVSTPLIAQLALSLS